MGKQKQPMEERAPWSVMQHGRIVMVICSSSLLHLNFFMNPLHCLYLCVSLRSRLLTLNHESPCQVLDRCTDCLLASQSLPVVVVYAERWCCQVGQFSTQLGHFLLDWTALKGAGQLVIFWVTFCSIWQLLTIKKFGCRMDTTSAALGRTGKGQLILICYGSVVGTIVTM